MTKQYYIVAAAGVGKRMGLGYPKQFLEYHGKPLFIITAEKIAACNSVDGYIMWHIYMRTYPKSISRGYSIPSINSNSSNLIFTLTFFPITYL